MNRTGLNPPRLAKQISAQLTLYIWLVGNRVWDYTTNCFKRFRLIGTDVPDRRGNICQRLHPCVGLLIPAAALQSSPVRRAGCRPVRFTPVIQFTS